MWEGTYVSVCAYVFVCVLVYVHLWQVDSCASPLKLQSISWHHCLALGKVRAANQPIHLAHSDVLGLIDQVSLEKPTIPYL